MVVDETHEQNEGLPRVLGLPSILIYGIGSILGAGIYTVVGKVAGVSGDKVWIAFLLAMLIALLNGLTYARIGRRMTRSGIEPLFFQKAFGRPLLASIVGWLVLCASVVSMATLTHAFAGYISEFLKLPDWSVFVAFPILLGAINFLGLENSSRANIVATLIEFSGLLLVLVSAVFFLAGEAPVPVKVAAPSSWDAIALLKGAALAFFAFIGFEDLINVVEEVKEPKRNLPIALLSAPFLAGLLYLAIGWVSVQVVPPSELAASTSPLLEVVKRGALPIPPKLFSAIALFAVFNTALLNSITASRLLYGMAKQKLLPEALTRVHSRRRSPWVAIVVVVALAIFLALAGSLTLLAGATSLILLVIFSTMNLALFKILRQERKSSPAHFILLSLPLATLTGNVLVATFIPGKSQWMALAILILGFILLGLYRFFVVDKGHFRRS